MAQTPEQIAEEAVLTAKRAAHSADATQPDLTADEVETLEELREQAM